MTVVVYPAVVTTTDVQRSQAAFVDFSDIKVEAGSTAALISAAREQLSATLLRLGQQGETWPEPTSLSDIVPPPGGLVVLIDVAVDDTPIRLTISLGERLLRRIDQDADARSMTRSGYLALGARRLLGETAEPAPGDGETTQRLQEEVAALGRRMTETLGPESPFGRRLADLDAIALDGFNRLKDELKLMMKSRATKSSGEQTKPSAAGSPVVDP
jgi:hypothetical protein